MRCRVGPLVVGLIVGVCNAVWAAEPPTAVSPGNASKVAVVEGRCPTFTWSQVEGAKSYQLVVYRLGEEGEEAKPVLRETFAGSVGGWTPSLDRCLDRGGRYAWAVRAKDQKEASEWSSPSLFEVAAGASEAEFEEAVVMVRDYLATLREPLFRNAASADKPLQGMEAEEVVEEETPGGAESIPAAPGGIQLSVDGSIAAGGFLGDGSGLSNLPAASDVACISCVERTDIAFNAITHFQVENNSLTGNDIQTASIHASDLAANAVGSSEIQTGAVKGAELDTIFPVAVRCQDHTCGTVSLTQICAVVGPGYEAVTVTCKDPQNHSGGSPCGPPGNTCYLLPSPSTTAGLGSFCDPAGGVDAIVFCIKGN